MRNRGVFALFCFGLFFLVVVVVVAFCLSELSARNS